MENTAAATVTAMDVAQIPFSDLLLVASPAVAEADEEQRRRLVGAVAAALGPGGAGLLAVADVPHASALRRRLLPMARRLALLDHTSRTQLLKKYGLGSDVPLKKLDRNVSSFAQLLRYSGESRLLLPPESIKREPDDAKKTPRVDVFQEFNDDGFESLGELFKELGLCMMELGILVARACDITIGGNQLEQSITDFGSAKARLIHYHSELDSVYIKQTSAKRKCLRKEVRTRSNPSHSQRSISSHDFFVNSEVESMVQGIMEKKSENDNMVQDQVIKVSLSDLWQEWHCDYGILTILTAPLFLSSSLGPECSISQECPPPNGHLHLQLFDRKKKKIFSARCSSESFIVQVGEAADILSGGKLRSTLHAVSRPSCLANISRETFVVFLQPSWDKTLTHSGYSSEDEDEASNHGELAFDTESTGSCSEHHQDVLMQEILRKIPPLSLRLKDGMTFAEFARQTTKQYYGGRGIQQNN